MNDLFRKIFSPILSLIIIMFGNAFINTSISVQIASNYPDSILPGIIYSGYYLGMMIGAIGMDNCIRKIGYSRAFSMFAAINAVAIMLQGFITSPLMWILFRIFAGLSCAGVFIVVESWLLLFSKSNTKGKMLSIYMISLYGSQVFGQFALNFFDLNSLHPFCATVVLSCVSIIPVSLINTASPSDSDQEFVNIFYILKKTPIGFFGNFTAGLILGAFYAMGPVFAKDLNLSISQISQVMGLTILGGLALQWPFGILSDIFERRKILLLNTFFLTIICVVLSFSQYYSFSTLLLLLVLFGGCSFTLYPLSITYCSDYFSSKAITAVTSACLIIYGIGCIFGPIVSAIVMKQTKPEGLFMYAAVLAGAYTIMGLFRARTVPPPSKSVSEEYVAIPGTSPQVNQLDPRIEENETKEPEKKEAISEEYVAVPNESPQFNQLDPQIEDNLTNETDKKETVSEEYMAIPDVSFQENPLNPQIEENKTKEPEKTEN